MALRGPPGPRLTMPPRKATLIVLAWNRWDLTKRCLDTLRKTDLTGAEVLVVDNGSEDETPEALKAYGWLRVSRNPSNLGFVRGNNAGIAAADPESDIVLLNNDMEFEQEDWLQRLRDCAHSTPDAGVVGCRLRLPDQKLLHAGTFILPDSMWGQQIGCLQKDVGQFTSTREVEGIVFACAYIRREVIKRIGALSEDFQSYFEDTDYCFRAREAGFRVLVCGDVTLVLREHGSTEGDDGRFMEIFQASREKFRKKWAKSLSERYTREVVWQSIMNFPTGYAMSCRAILRALDRRGSGSSTGMPTAPGRPFRFPRSVRAATSSWTPCATAATVRALGSRSFTARATFSIGTGAAATSDSPCSRWTASRMTGSARPTRWTRSGCRRSSTARDSCDPA